MKKRFTRILAALALLVFMMPSLVAWGQTRDEVTSTYIFTSKSWTATLNGSQANWISGRDGGGFSNNGIQVTTTYSGANGTSPISFQNVTRIVATYNTNKSAGAGTIVAKIGDNAEVTKDWAYSGSGDGRTANYTVQWDYATAQTGSVKITCNTTTNSIYLVSVAITTSSGGTPTVAAPTFSPDNGTTFEETLQVTLSQADNKAIYYNINSESDPDANSTPYTGPISISATSTIKAIAIDGENTSSVATATYTKLVYNNIEDIVANQTQYAVKGTVVAKNSRGFVMGDGTGYVYYYKNSAPTQAIGDYVTISGTTSTYGHILQFPSGASVGTATSSNYDGTPLVAIVDATAMAEYNQDYQLSDYVQYEGFLTKNGSYFDIAVGTAKARISYPTDAQSSTLTNLLNKTVRVKGYFAGIQSYNNESYFTTMLESVEEVVSTDPILSVDPTSLSFTYAQGATEVPTESFSIIGSNLTDDVTVTLPSNYAMYDAETGDPISSSYTLTPEDGVINTTLVVELNSGLQQGSYNGTITIEWEGEENLTVALTGTVTEPEPENVTWDLTVASYDEGATANLVTWSSEYATMTNAKGTSQTNANNGLGGVYEHTRFYKDNVLTITPATGYSISRIEITAVSGYVAGFTGNAWTNATASADGTLVTVTPTDGNNACSVVISAACRATQVKVYYTISTATFYAINIDDEMENGTIVANYEEATEGTTVTLSVFPAAGYYLAQNDIVIDATGVTLTKVNDATYTFVMPASAVTVSAVFSVYSGTYYTLVTSTDQLIAGRHYIIANSMTGGSAYAMGAQVNNYREQVEATVVGTMIYETANVHEVVLNDASNNLWTLYDEGYLYASSTSNNNLGTRAFNNANDPEKGQWAISFNESAAIIVSQIGSEAPNTIKYNAGNSRFSCYTTTSSLAPVYLYMKANETEYTYVKDIAAYQGDGGYVLVASPVSTTPEDAGMITDTEGANATPETAIYDLYSFDQAQELEWINYRQGEFNLEPGKGYLYANKNNVTLTFAGVPSTTSTATLSLSGNGEFAGWNLVGNPFSVPAYIGNRAYYRIGNGGADIVAATPGTAIDVMEGVFVIAAQDEEQLTFSTTAAKGASVAMNVVRERGNVIDRAIVRFDEGDQLPKFQLNPNNTKIYVTEGNKDYAVVRSAAEAEMPVSFKASKNGTYTLAVEAENVEMNYLHLIDNMTGMDVDLLQTPSYTFEAKTSDYASRFRLVFKANGTNENNAETFAYFNGTNWTVSNVGDATLQVVDVTGRTVANQMINGNAELNLNQPAGVYVIRLVNGDNVKTQKVVVR